LRQILENLRLDELDNIDIEEVLNRIENLNYIVRRYGSEEGALDALNQRKKELEGLEQIDDKIDELSAKFEQISSEISQNCAQISASRSAVVKGLGQIKLPSDGIADVQITVTAEDGSVRIYKIKVAKEG